jgi:hypothetical protein
MGIQILILMKARSAAAAKLKTVKPRQALGTLVRLRPGELKYNADHEGQQEKSELRMGGPKPLCDAEPPGQHGGNGRCGGNFQGLHGQMTEPPIVW